MLENKKILRFTLVELLVVISIVSFLTFLLLPLLAKRISCSRDFKCRNSQRQLYLVSNNYAEVYGRFPKVGGGSWRKNLAEFLAIGEEDIRKNYICEERAALGVAQQYSDYGFNIFVTTDMRLSGGLEWLKLTQFAIPDATYLFSDTVSFVNPNFPNGHTGNGTMDTSFIHPDRRHCSLSRYNISFADGHLESLFDYSRVPGFPEWRGRPGFRPRSYFPR